MSHYAPCDPPFAGQLGVESGALLAICGGSLNRRSGILRRGDGTETLLRPKTAELAALLASNAGRVVSRSEILDAVWPGVFVTDDSITQCVVELRRALGAGAAGVLRTIPRRGYILEIAPAAPAPAPSPSPSPMPAQRRPRVSALPLNVPGGDPTLVVLGDWMAEEICRTLSRSSLLTVISHLSGRAMAGRMVDLASVRETLSADYLVSGSLRRVRSEVVCDIDMVDVASGAILWTRNIVCPADALMDSVGEHLADVLQAIGRSIAEATLRAVRGRELPNVPKHELLIAGVARMHRPARAEFVAAERYLAEAANRPMASPDVHAWLGKWYVLNVFKGYSTDRDGDTRRALDCTARALDEDPDSSFSLVIDGFAHGNILRDFGTAARRYAAALYRNPNESLGWLLHGALLAFQDNGAAAVEATTTARRLSPIDPFGYYYDSLASTAHLSAENYQQALVLADRSLAANDQHISTLRSKITAQHCLGDGDGARATASELRRRFPDFRLDDYRRTHPSSGQELGRVVIEALRAAGIS